MQADEGKTSPEGWQFEKGAVYTVGDDGNILNTTLFDKSIVKFGLDMSKELNKNVAKEMNFAKITQFEGKRKTVMVIRNYLKDMLRRSRERSKEYQWNGWLKEENWIGWQGHVENLIKRLEELLEKEGDTIQFWNAGMQRAEKKQMMKLE